MSDDGFLFQVSNYRPRLDLDRVLQNLREFAVAHDVPHRSKSNYQKWSGRQFHPQTVINYFGSWVKAMERAGILYDRFASVRPNKAAVDEDLQRFAKAHAAPKRTFKNYEAWKRRRVPVGTVRAVYGTWYDAMVALGVECPGRSKSKKNSDDDLLVATERVWRWSMSKKGRSPSQKDFQNYSGEHADGVAHGTIIRRFGPMARFLKSFAQWKRGETTKAELLALTPKKQIREPISKKLRYELIKEAKGRCNACGSSVVEGAILQIDHIIPVAKGGTNDRANLRVACQVCNIGKGTIIETS